MARAVVPRLECAHCGKLARCPTVILEQLVCDTCRLRYRRSPRTCPGCGSVKVLAWYDSQRRPACAACTGNPSRYGCTRCGREDCTWGRLCAVCALGDRLTALMSTPDGAGIHPQLRPVYDTLVAGPRPQSTLFWMTRRHVGPDILHAMATGVVPITHQTFDQLPANRATYYLRDLLVACGVLDPYDPELARVQPWLDQKLAVLPRHVGDPIRRYAMWHLLRRLRATDRAGRLTHSAILRARSDILNAARFLTWLDQQDMQLHQLTQPILEEYTVQHPPSGRALRGFIRWHRKTGTIGPLDAPDAPRPDPEVTVADEQRWADVDTLLHDSTIRLYVRIAGLFILLYAQPLSRVVTMRPHQVLVTETTVSVTFDEVPIELPTPLDQLLRDHLGRRGQASYHAHPNQWLFPGGHPGRHLHTENIRSQLAARGIHPGTGRHAALFHLAGTIPVPVLADLLGLSPKTASRWAALAGRSWTTYLADRLEDDDTNTPQSHRNDQ